MNKDLEEQLNEMGPGYRAVVDRLRAAREAGVGEKGERGESGEKGESGETRGWLLAASLILVVGLSVVFTASNVKRQTSNVKPQTSNVKRQTSNLQRPAPRDYTMSVEEMIRTQNADGSWKNDFLTRQNAAALKLCDSAEARVAYKKAVRNLRVRGVL